MMSSGKILCTARGSQSDCRLPNHNKCTIFRALTQNSALSFDCSDILFGSTVMNGCAKICVWRSKMC